MRIYLPKNYDKKVKKKFAFFPIQIGNEIRWLEWVVVKYWFNEENLIFNWSPEKFIDIDNRRKLRSEIIDAKFVEGFSEAEILELENSCK